MLPFWKYLSIALELISGNRNKGLAIQITRFQSRICFGLVKRMPQQGGS